MSSYIMYHFRIRISAGNVDEGTQNQASNDEAPKQFATEDTPAQFSRNESLSDLSNCEEENDTTLTVGSNPIPNYGMKIIT